MGGNKIIEYMGSLFYKVTNLGTLHLSSTGVFMSSSADHSIIYFCF